MELFLKIIACIFLAALGVLMLIKPDIIWKIEHFFSVKNGEPTDWYIAGTRIIGTAAIFISVFCAGVFFVF